MDQINLVLWMCLLAAVSGYPYFRDQIPNGKKVPHPCKPNYVWKGVGHENEMGGGDRNPFGRDWLANGKVWDECLCRTDSDGDGRTNGEELGDPDCNWPEKTPSTKGLSHPGVCEPIDSAECMERNTWNIDCSLEQFKCPELDETKDAENVTLRMSPTRVPAEETTYICQFFELGVSHEQDFHLIAFEPFIDNDYVMHHLILYGCLDEYAEDVRKNFSKPTLCGMETFLCPQMIALWTVGNAGTCLAPEYGVRLGKTGFKYALMEMHWNNPEIRHDYMDSSGLTLHYTPTLRDYDGSTFFVGPVYLELPPGYKEMTNTGYCPGECTSHMFTETVKIATVTPHMHYLGRKMFAEQRRDGERVRIIVNEEDYSYDEPVSYDFRPPLDLMPGDEIHVTCTFDTSANDNVIYFGLATSDEMCLLIVQYYPLQANHSDCFGDDGGVAFCGEKIAGVDKIGPCFYTAAYDFNATSEFWRVWYPLMAQHCDSTGSVCYDGCKELFEQLADRYACYGEDAITVYKSSLADYRNVLPQDFMMYLASCGGADRADWLHVDDLDDVPGKGEVSDDDDICVLPPSKGANIIYSPFILISVLVFYQLFH